MTSAVISAHWVLTKVVMFCPECAEREFGPSS